MEVFFMIKNTYIVEKSNLLNEIRSTNMSLQELRFFSIYLSKINARNVSTRCVRFSMSDFQKIMGFGRLNIKQLQASTNKLLCKVVNVPNSNGGYTGFPLFKRVCVFKDDFENWNLEIDASDDALPLFFNLKGNYFTYELWNALKLNSANHLRMYEFLKQREILGKFEIKISELRELLYIDSNKYIRLRDFKTYILDSCQKALAESTDICFTYECGKRGARGKWLTIVFHISKNNKHSDPLELQDFIDKQPAGTNVQVVDEQSELDFQMSFDDVPNDKELSKYSNESISFLASACDNEFTEAQMNEIFVIISNMDFIEHEYKDNNLSLIENIRFSRFNYLREVYSRLNVYAETHEVHNRYACFKTFIINDRNQKRI